MEEHFADVLCCIFPNRKFLSSIHRRIFLTNTPTQDAQERKSFGKLEIIFLEWEENDDGSAAPFDFSFFRDILSYKGEFSENYPELVLNYKTEKKAKEEFREK